MNFGSRKKKIVGIDRIVRVEWLERAANLVLAGNDAKSVQAELEHELTSFFPSSNPRTRGSLSKTCTILIRTWARVPGEIQPLRDAGLDLLRHLPKDLHLAIHWGMVMAAYPFWGEVASSTGRLLRLQSNATASQVQRRLRERYGERETVSRRVRYVLRSFIEWGLLKESGKKGLYVQNLFFPVDHPHLISWMIESLLHTRPEGMAPLRDLVKNPRLFPFRLNQVTTEELLASSRLELLRHGLDDEVVLLRGSA